MIGFSIWWIGRGQAIRLGPSWRKATKDFAVILRLRPGAPELRREKAGDGIRTHDINVGNVALYH